MTSPQSSRTDDAMKALKLIARPYENKIYLDDAQHGGTVGEISDNNHGYGTDVELASRIVHCVNACGGLDTEALKDISLMALLEEIIPYIVVAEDSYAKDRGATELIRKLDNFVGNQYAKSTERGE